jgi:tetratricopeptide (TPR) repeat protein
MDTQEAQQIHEGREAYDRGDFRTALRLFRQVLLRQPGYADIRNLAGLCLSFLGEPQEAIEQFDEALTRNPGYVEAHINRALTLNNLGRLEEGWEAFERAARYEQEAMGQFSSAVAARLANAHAAVGDLYRAAGGLALAVEQYRIALALRPRFQDIRNKLGQCLLDQGQAEAASAEFREALAGNERFLVARLNLGLAYSRLGRHAEALEEWRRCEREDPQHPQVRAYLSTLGTRTEESDAQ